HQELTRVFELRQLFQRFLSLPWQLDFTAVVLENGALKGDRYHVPADVEKSADLQDRNENFVLSNDDILYCPDLLVLVIDHAAADQLARTIALRHRVHIDHELDALREYGEGQRGDQHRRDECRHITKARGQSF